MELRVLGCHGGETPRHRTTAFLLDERLAIDAGSLTSQLELPDQDKLEGVLVSHAHLDHVRDLATIADNRSQRGCGPLKVIAAKPTILHLKKHFFNDVLWPDFAAIPTKDEPTIEYVEIPVDRSSNVLGYDVTPIEVHHTIESVGFVIADAAGAIGFSGDTGPTDRFWEVLNGQPNVKALLMEVSFPNAEAGLATVSGHHTPKTLRADLQKYSAPQDLATMLYHIKPQFQAEVEKECAKLKKVNLHVLKLTEQFIL
ncbi:MAG: 3',5'-cyclic-nucleotide phosphodiesterase [Deltaproteobacteria bacterium]|jgi:3',5'-cyclic-nucleotide phosphodiesterase|nr:3',5'-cyclic-nucleotide phosphodiesterase [Deltaproteobacteria bacterium]